MPTIKTLLLNAAQTLQHSDSPKVDAEILLAHCLNKPKSYLYTWPEDGVGGDALAQFERLLAQRAQGVPVAYLIGQQGFWSYDFYVNEHVLIPRPETELLVSLAQEKLTDCIRPTPSLIDLGTGSGCIGLSLALDQPNLNVLCLDQSEHALAVAQKNAKNLNAKNVTFAQSNWCSAIFENTSLNTWSHDVDVVVSNPPYICDDDAHLTQGDVRFEPSSALSSGKDGLDDIRIIAKQAQCVLSKGGWLLLEHGYDQSDAVCALLEQTGYMSVSAHQDFNGIARVVCAQLS